MASSSEDSAGLLKRVQILVDSDPESQEGALRDLANELEASYQKRTVNNLEQAVQHLGTAVGSQKDWQTPFRETGILGFALNHLDTDTASLRKQLLRVIGNCVADNDLNREVVTKDLDRLITLIKDDAHSTIVLIVLFNLCNDFDPAKAAAATLRLDTSITAELSSQKFAAEAIDYAVDLLTWTTGKLTAEQLKDETSLSSFRNLLRVALQYDEDHYHEYVAILVHYIQDLDFQEKICAPEILDDLVVLMLDFEARLSAEEIEAVFNELAITKTDDTAKSEETTVLLLSQLINSISGISATNAFATAFSLTTPVIERTRTKLALPTDDPQKVALPLITSPSTMAACVLLGNLATSDSICIEMVKNWQIHIPLREILLYSTHSALLYAAAGYLRHLAFPEANRSTLGHDVVLEACQHVVSAHPADAAVAGETAALIGKIISNNFENIKRLVNQLNGEPTCLQTLVHQSLQPATPLPSTSMKNFSIESGRIIVSILRYLGRFNAVEEEEDTRQIYAAIFDIPHIARPVARLVRQRFYTEARAEGLLGLGLMAQSTEGAARVVDEIREDGGLLGAVKEMAEGKEEGSGNAGGGGREYQNAMVLLQALQNKGVGDDDEELKGRIVELQESLGKMMV